MIFAGKEYGTGSSRDWAAKGPSLLGVKAVMAQSYERIHRSNLIGMGILPLEFKPGESAESLGLTGKETYSIEGLGEALGGDFKKGVEVKMVAHRKDAEGGDVPFPFSVISRLDTPQEVEYVRHGGILQYVLRGLAKS